MNAPAVCRKEAVCPYCNVVIRVGEQIGWHSRDVAVHASISGRYMGSRKSYRPKHWDDRVCYRNQMAAEKAKFDAETEDSVASIREIVADNVKDEAEAAIRKDRASKWELRAKYYADAIAFVDGILAKRNNRQNIPARAAGV